MFEIIVFDKYKYELMEVEDSDGVSLMHLVSHWVTGRWLPVEVNVSGSSCFGGRVCRSEKETTRGGGFLSDVALHHLGSLISCRQESKLGDLQINN